ncbi:hypothetical protein L6164_013686 [Bauhinia variegata]|uniref:Uncharacterized protein n=1 Tax=Bauhinia variegata TaxID=167791 RepID=A0ACB9NIJ7_BAUVA|nr:hypothetical protein L6164_013686 [Bauhinia variegata]
MLSSDSFISVSHRFSLPSTSKPRDTSPTPFRSRSQPYRYLHHLSLFSHSFFQALRIIKSSVVIPQRFLSSTSSSQAQKYKFLSFLFFHLPEKENSKRNRRLGVYMASSLISNAVTSSDRSRDISRRKKKKKAQLKHQQEDQNHIKWKSQAQQQIYSSKLRQALARVNLGSSSSSASEAPRRGKAVREAADRVLAVTAKGRTRWSRAILMNRLKLKFRKHKRQRVTAVTGAGRTRSKKPRVSVYRLKGKSLPTVQRKVRFLGRLVPGCRKQPLPVILEETIDYISALEMQIRAMSTLADLLSGSSSGAGSSSAPPPG